MLPEGWDYQTLGEISGPMTSGSRGWAAYYAEQGSPFIRITNLRRESIIPDYSKMKYVSLPTNSQEGQRTRLTDGDILISITADLGIIGYIDGEPKQASYINQHIARVRIRRECADPKFVAHQLASERHRVVIQRLNDAGAKSGLNLPTIQSIPVLLPPLPEQRRIAAVLDAWDTAIATAERLVSAQLHLRMGIEDNVLGQGEPTRFADAADVWFSGVDKKIVEGEQSVRLCNYMDVLNNRRLTDDIAFSIGSATSGEAQRFALQQGDIVFTKDSETAAEIAEPSYVAESLTNVVCGYHLGIARPKEGISGAYLTHAIRSQKIRQQFVRRANGAIRFGLTLEAMDQIELPLPGLNRQVAIAGVLDAVDDEIARLGALTEALRHQKRGLMQQLLTGKLPVPESVDQLMPEAGGVDG
jgi:type I restriction enzyme, S subunit